MNDENERSVASAGSVDKPVAWAVPSPEWHEPLITFCPDAAEQAASKVGSVVFPLYRCPKLRPHERDAIGVAIQCLEAAQAQRHPEQEEEIDLLHKASCFLSSLLERMK